MRRDGIVAPMRGGKPRVAVAGLGIGRAHVKGLLEEQRAELCALCDVDRALLRRISAETGVAARYSDFERLLRDERPDAVVIATPSDLHEPMALAALEAGCHVMIEKPLAHTLASAKAIAAAAARRPRQLVMLDLFARFGAAARTAKRWLDSGRCGRLYHASTYWCRTRGIPTWSPWKLERRHSGGGPVLDLGVHRIDLALWLLGEPEVETAAAVTHGELGRALHRSAKRRSGKFDVEEFGGGILRLEGDRAVVFEVSWAENSGRREVILTRVLGERGGAVHRNVDHGSEFVAELYGDRRGKLAAVEPGAFARPALVPAREFVRAIAGGAAERRDLPDARTGLRLQRVLAAILRSAEEGREVALAELDGGGKRKR
jgi:predicted dehydrogenase